MANDIQFYSTDNLNKIPIGSQNGAIYFVLKDNNVASLFVDLNNSRYEVKTEIPEATEDMAGLLSATDKRKLIPISIEKYNNRTDINTEKSFNFLKNITINNEDVLTKSSIAGVNVVKSNDNKSYLELVETEEKDGHYFLNLYLNLNALAGPQGPKGDTGEPGPQGLPGKPTKIKNITASYLGDEEEGSPTISTSSSYVETDQSFDTTLDFEFKNLKGPEGPKGAQGEQGKVGKIEFKFQTGGENDEIGCVSNPITKDDGEEVTLVTVTIPRGPKGDKGKNFTISRTFNSVPEMEAALEETVDEQTQAGIPRETFVLISSTDDDPAHGELYYCTIASELKLITDLVPIQPRFSVVEDVSILPWDANGTSILTYPNPSDLSAPRLSFQIPRGKPMDFGSHIGNIIYNNDDDTSPSVDITSTNTIVDSDTRKQDLTFNFINLGKIYKTTVGTENINIVGTPQVTVTPSIEDNKQKLHFNFEYLKGEKGDIGPAPIINPNINISVTSGNPNENPAGTASWTTDEEGKKVLNLNLTNVKGKQGDFNDLNIFESSEGNAVSSISYNGGGDISVSKDYFKNKSNIEDVSHGGTGLSTISSNSILLGNETNNLKTVANAAGVLCSNGTDAPYYDTIPVTLGGTGLTSLTKNAILAGNGVDEIKQIETQFGALYSEGSGTSAKFGILPVSYGGTGNQNYPVNSVLIGNRDKSFKFVNSVKGVLISSGEDAEPSFGTLGVTDGGTGLTSLTTNSVLLGNGTNNVKQVRSLKGALYSNADIEEPQFGTLPVNVGGTGATTAAQARVNLGATYTKLVTNPSKENDYILKIENTVTPV